MSGCQLRADVNKMFTEFIRWNMGMADLALEQLVSPTQGSRPPKACESYWPKVCYRGVCL